MQVKAFYFIRKEDADEVLECGIKREGHSTRTISVHGTSISCFEAYLHPADIKNKSNDVIPVKIVVPDNKTFIADDSLSGQRYEQSIVPHSQYKMGSYRSPVCLITCTLLPYMIEQYDPNKDEALLYHSSEQLYCNRLFYNADDASDTFKDIALYAYYTSKDVADMYSREEDGNYILFISRDTGSIEAVVRKHNQ